MGNNNNFKELISNLTYLGIVPDGSGVRNNNVGTSDYNSGKHCITPWSIWLDYPELTPFDHDIIKRVLRKKTDPNRNALQMRKEDYEKIIHICQERIRQIDFLINAYAEADGNIKGNNNQ